MEFTRHWESQRQLRFPAKDEKILLKDCKKSIRLKKYERWNLPWTIKVKWEIAFYVVWENKEIITIMTLPFEDRYKKGVDHFKKWKINYKKK